MTAVPDSITSLLTNYLNVQSRRTQVTAANLANADTPGFQAQELDFNAHLHQAAGAGAARSAGELAGRVIQSAQRHLAAVTPPALTLHPLEQPAPAANLEEPSLVAQTGNPVGIDGNTVDPLKEMATLSDAGMKYLFGTQMLQSHWRMLRTAIREGK